MAVRSFYGRFSGKRNELNLRAESSTIVPASEVKWNVRKWIEAKTPEAVDGCGTYEPGLAGVPEDSIRSFGLSDSHRSKHKVSHSS